MIRPRARRGAALLAALAALALLGALAVTVGAVAWRARRGAVRATLARRALDAAEGSLATWEVALARDASALAGDPPGIERELARPAAGDDPAVRVTVAALAGGVRLLVADARAGASGQGGMRARRRVALLLVPDTLAPVLPDTGVARPVLRRAPERAWIDLP